MKVYQVRNHDTKTVILCIHEESSAFTVHSRTAATVAVGRLHSPSNSSSSSSAISTSTSLTFIHQKQQQQSLEDDLALAAEAEEVGKGKEEASKRQRMRSFGQMVMERSDTFRSAGFYNKNHEHQHEHHEPLISGAKTNITLFVLALGYKWYRSIFINKVRERERHDD